jgi:diguanylate cyclase (GGDEF)-like protein/PAS domain S-box-containing protein
MSGEEFEASLQGLLDAIVDELAGQRADDVAGTPSGDAAGTPSGDAAGTPPGDLTGEPAGDAATNAGTALVAAHAVGQQSLLRSIEVLGTGLPELPELAGQPAVTQAVVSVLGRIATGYSDAIRRKTFGQQEDVKQALERVLRLSETRFREVFVASAVGIAISDLDGTLVRANRALAEILGYTPAELTHRNLYELFVRGAGDQLRAAYRDVVSGKIERFRLHRPMLRKDGDEAWAIIAVSALRDMYGAITHHLTMVEDITDLHLLQERLNSQALHDVLTGLPNRQAFALKVESALGQLDPAAMITLFQLDVDSFSVINDGLGYHVGDRLLQLVTQRLQFVFAEEDALIARIASDEFAVLVENSPNTPDVATLAARINEELSEPAYLEEVGLAVTVSIGVVQRPAGSVTHVELLRQADSTLRRAKNNGRRQWALFDAPQDARDRERYTRVAAMPGALENGEFRIEYQPLVRLADRRVIGIEALISWDRPGHGTMRHDEVMELAGHTGVVLSIGTSMLRAACADAARWHELLGDATPTLSINLASAQANDPDLVGTVNGVLSSVGLPAHQLQLGLPVRALLCEDGDAEDNLQVLADTGVRTSLHGFGAGHGGLVFLEDLPVRAVRIAAWLVRRLAQRPDSVTGRALTDLMSLVHMFGAAVVIPGLPTQELADWWRHAGADIASGSFYAPPGPPEAITDLLLSP